MTDIFQLDENEINRRKAYLEFTENDIALLKDLHEKIGDNSDFFVEGFYAHLLNFSELHDLLGDDATLARLKNTQTAYFSQLTAGEYGGEYIQNRIRVGTVHERIGLKPKWYMGAYCKYLSLALPKITNDGDSKESKTTLALLKILFLDMSIAIDTYIDAHQQAIQNKSTQISALNEIAVAISSTMEWQALLDTIMRSGMALTRSKAACLAFCDENTQNFGECHTYGLSDNFIENMSFRPGGLAHKSLTSGKFILSNEHPETEYKLSELARSEGIRCSLCLPFVSNDHPLGVLYLYRNDRDTFLPDEIDLLTTFANLSAIAATNTRRHANTMKQAKTDALTGLSNRHALEDSLKTEHQRAQRNGKAYSLLMLDIDFFKNVNDTYGHPAGDAVLTRLATILEEHTRDIDSVARFGGEEFLIIMPETASKGASVVAERIRQAVADTLFTLPDQREIKLTVSIGISSFPQHANNTSTLLDVADQALYQAKHNGRNKVVLYQQA